MDYIYEIEMIVDYQRRDVDNSTEIVSPKVLIMLISSCEPYYPATFEQYSEDEESRFETKCFSPRARMFLTILPL